MPRAAAPLLAALALALVPGTAAAAEADVEAVSLSNAVYSETEPVFTVTFTVRNNGPDPTELAASIDGHGAYDYHSHSNSANLACTNDGGQDVHCRSQLLAAGETASVSLRGKGDLWQAPGAGFRGDTDPVSPGTTDPDPSNNQRAWYFIVGSGPGPVSPGEKPPSGPSGGKRKSRCDRFESARKRKICKKRARALARCKKVKGSSRKARRKRAACKRRAKAIGKPKKQRRR